MLLLGRHLAAMVRLKSSRSGKIVASSIPQVSSCCRSPSVIAKEVGTPNQAIETMLRFSCFRDQNRSLASTEHPGNLERADRAESLKRSLDVQSTPGGS
jgi:hypothetical protein